MQFLSPTPFKSLPSMTCRPITVGYRLLALQTNEFIITNNATFVLSSEILVKDLFGTELTEKRQEELYQQLCKSAECVLVNSGEKSYVK